MSEQALDLKRSAKIIRRHKILVSAITALGILAGGAYAALHHPTVTSTAQVLLPVTAQSAASAAAGASNAYEATQEAIAASNDVLSGALPDVRPAMSLSDLQHNIQIGNVTAYIISVSASGPGAADAEATANAVAKSYISYIKSAPAPIGPVHATLLEAATNATGKAPIDNYIAGVLVGALAGALIGASTALLIGRNDRRLRSRDQIADSIGVPVLASVRVSTPSDAAGWANLLRQYQPGEVDAWRMRRIFHQLGGLGFGSWERAENRAFSLTMLSLSTDRNALALGPQLAVLAASLGIPTALVIGPQQDPSAMATLRAACQAPDRQEWANGLRIVVSDHEDARRPPDAMLTIVAAVVDSKEPRIADSMRTTTTLLGISAGAATEEQMARVAANAAAVGRDITGIVLADADPGDVTTGRLPQPARSAQRRMPTRMTGTATEIRQ